MVNAAEEEQEISGIRRAQMYNPRLFKFSLGVYDLSYWVDGAFLQGMISWRPRYIERNGLHLDILCHSIQRVISWILTDRMVTTIFQNMDEHMKEWFVFQPVLRIHDILVRIRIRICD